MWLPVTCTLLPLCNCCKHCLSKRWDFKFPVVHTRSIRKSRFVCCCLSASADRLWLSLIPLSLYPCDYKDINSSRLFTCMPDLLMKTIHRRCQKTASEENTLRHLTVVVAERKSIAFSSHLNCLCCVFMSLSGRESVQDCFLQHFDNLSSSTCVYKSQALTCIHFQAGNNTHWAWLGTKNYPVTYSLKAQTR